MVLFGFFFFVCSGRICVLYGVFFFFFKQKTAYEMLRSLVGSEMCIRDRSCGSLWQGITTPSVWWGKACLASAATTAESMPPDRPNTAPLPPPAVTSAPIHPLRCRASASTRASLRGSSISLFLVGLDTRRQIDARSVVH